MTGRQGNVRAPDNYVGVGHLLSEAISSKKKCSSARVGVIGVSGELASCWLAQLDRRHYQPEKEGHQQLSLALLYT